MFILDSN